MRIVVDVVPNPDRDTPTCPAALKGPVLYVVMPKDPTRYVGVPAPQAVERETRPDAVALGVITSLRNIFASLYELHIMTEGTVRYMPPSQDLEVPVMAKYANGLLNLGHGTAYASPAIFNPVRTPL